MRAKPTSQKMTRQLPINGIRQVEGEERRFVLSFSSEEPYKRWFGTEILDHSEGAADLTRLNAIGVLLFNHDPNKVLGKIISAEVKDRRGEAVVEFDTDEFAETVYQKVKNGTLKGVSVGYFVDDDSWEFVKDCKKSADGRFSGPCYIGHKWSALEISIASVPADATVGVGRDFYAGERNLNWFKNKVNENIKNLPAQKKTKELRK